MIRIKNLKVHFADTTELPALAAKRLKISVQDILEVAIVRKAVDARRYRGAPIQFVYMLDVKVRGSEKKIIQTFKKDSNISLAEKPADVFYGLAEKRPADLRPVVVGFGPAGMFAALTLARQGWEPIVLERGQDVDTRLKDIENLWKNGVLLPSSNVQFGEGGAGTFSDGKLTTRINDEKMDDVLDVFVAAGAPEEIKYLHKPHIGTDLLRGIVKNIRQEIIKLGGQVRFGAKLTDIEISQGKVRAAVVNGEERIETDVIFLGIGHSARDTYEMLYKKGVVMEAKSFAVGVRIEHPQEFIDRAQYGADAGHENLPAADYALTYQDKDAGRGAYSFCMCPGGQVVAAASEEGRVVTNGMSNYKRDSGIANSALLVTVSPEDFGGHVLSGMQFQRQCEELAFELAGRNYYAPVQTVGDFLRGQSGSTEFLTTPTYRPGVKAVDLHQCLPNFVTDTLEGALLYFDRRISGFADDGVVMTGVETRSSAPCRIRRNRISYLAENMAGLYPMGEGAGYAGGIMSAAVDGMNAVLAFLQGNSHTNNK